MNDIVKKTLDATGLPSVLELVGLNKGVSRPDGMTVLPFARDRCVIWDCMDVDAFWDSNAIESSNMTEAVKLVKYASLNTNYDFGLLHLRR